MTDIERAIAEVEQALDGVMRTHGMAVDYSRFEFAVSDLQTILTALQSQQPKTQFEQWKQGLTIEQATELLSNPCCEDCPAGNYCMKLTLVGKNDGCANTFKEWGEQSV